MCNNVRGVKSKEEIIKRIINDENPVIMALVETKLDKDDIFNIDGYEIERNDRVADGGGVLIAYKKSFRNIMTIGSKYNDHNCEILWMKLDNGIEKVRIGVVYMPQECRTLLKDIKSIYKAIVQEVEAASERGEKIVMMGDFNCKVGLEVAGNNKEVSKGGRELLKLANKLSLKILNSNKCCRGLWTRQQDNERSILDYILVNKEDVKLVNFMKIDKERDVTPYALDQSTLNRVYTDHFMITCHFNWKMEEKQLKQVRRLDKRNLEAYRNELEAEKVSNIIDDRPIRLSYPEWCKKTLRIRDKYSSKKKIRRKWKVHRQLVREKKKINRQLEVETNKDLIKELKVKKATIMDLIDEELIQKQYTRINNIVSDVRKAGGVNSTTFWEVRNKFLGRNSETADIMEDENGILQDDPEEIKEIYARYFEKLLRREGSLTKAGKDAEETINLVERGMEVLARKEEPQETNKEDVSSVVQKLNIKKARDIGTWSNIDIKEREMK